ncbi:MAG: ATP-dependent RecD-like DNA helicase [Clostridiales bacterium]|nr:ATP-dependent RecD-like DNA helicase [Clostridiales bacterium]
MENGQNEQIELNGIVEDVTFRNDDTGFTVLVLAANGELVTVVGVLPGITCGENLRVRGGWDFHPAYGRQFRAELCERSMPKTADDLLKYLSSGIIKGIGPSTAIKIIEKFGENTFDVMENQPERLAEIKGISEKKALEISKNFKSQFAVREVMIALERFGMTTSECLKAYMAFGVKAPETVEENPYILCNSDLGISFDRADEIAENLPNKTDKINRVLAGVIHVVKTNVYNNGHTCLPRKQMLVPCTQLLDISEDEANEAVDELIRQKRLVSETFGDKEYLFLHQIYRAEINASNRILQMLAFPPAGKLTLQRDIDNIEIAEGIKYEEKQRLAITTAIQKGILILTGGPGTGKTTTLNGILRIMESDGLDVLLTAPTGRAAKRMSDVTGRDAKTIHRLLEVEWDSHDRPIFSRNQTNPLECHAVIVDELSMVDVSLFSSLLDALPIGCRLIMVGDSDQLPAVGAGNVLHDLIESGRIPVVELKEVFRQAMESVIVTNAHKIVSGEMPDLTVRDRDFFFMERKTPYSAAQTVVELCASRLPNAYGYTVDEKIQVLCPSRKGETGTNNLNRLLQAAINPPAKGKKEIKTAGRLFREGDKVMQIKNNYNVMWERDGEEGSGIFNGDIGILKEINQPDGTMRILFDDRDAVYPIESAAELEHAYAVTVHKSQGNEFDAVIMPVIDIVAQLAYRNILYTAVTRAKNIMITVGSEETIRAMVNNNKQTKRYSALKKFLLRDGDSL